MKFFIIHLIVFDGYGKLMWDSVFDPMLSYKSLSDYSRRNEKAEYFMLKLERSISIVKENLVISHEKVYIAW